MFQRWGNRQPAIGYPTNFVELDQENDYQERYLETIPEVESISSRRQSVQLALPELPFRAVAPMSEMPQSVDVQQQQQQSPTSPARHPREQGLRIKVPISDHVIAEEVSPITPTTSVERNRDENPISPLDTPVLVQARDPLPERTHHSQIPRKISRKGPQDDSTGTRWDAFSGEPTNDQSGQPASVRPGTQPVELQYPHLKERTKQILAGLREREAAKQKHFGKASPAVPNNSSIEPFQRQPGKGQSGRVAILEPVYDNPSAHHGPLKRSAPIMAEPNMEDTPEKAPIPIQTSITQKSPTMDFEEDIKPIVPLKSAKKNKSQDSTLNKSVHNLVTEPEPAHPSKSPESVVIHARVESPPYDPEPTTPTTPTSFHTPPLAEKPNHFPSTYEPHEFDREQSRFSWTTYTTSANESSSSPVRAVFDSSPPLPSAIPPPITVRKRPVSANILATYSPLSYNSPTDSSFNGILRKPLPNAAARASSGSTAALRAASTSKSLPPTPTVVEATDKIENLEAQLDALNRRKYNVLRIVRDLEDLLRKNAIIYDMWKRKEVEKNIVNHKLALDDIGSDIHEISIQLHRAQRKRDREDNYESCTGLWIKRVTS